MQNPIIKLWRYACVAIALAFALNAAPGQAQQCTVNCLTPGDYDLTMQWDGLQRSFKVHVPASYTGNAAVALTLDLHGHALTNTDQRNRSGQLQQSDRLGFIAVWPQGVVNSWNGHGCCTTAFNLQVDDVGFLRQVIATIKARAFIDSSKVYVTGWSNGGGMTQRMGCQAADVVRAIAPVAHPLNTNNCNPSQPISTLHFHGTADEVIPYDGGGHVLPRQILGIPLGWQGARQSLAAWKLVLGCSSTLSATQLNGASRDETYTDCAGQRMAGLVTVADGKHDLYTPDGSPGQVAIARYIWDHVFVP